jgi:hypothetical protein
MNINFINHASILIKTRNISIISDPWLFGNVFNEGWSLLCKSPAVDWSNIDFIWISHEHPDHFHIPTLLSISDKDKGNLTVLYQNTLDKKVLKWLKNKNFRVRELPLLKKIEIAPKVYIKTGSTPQDDSWLLIDDGKTKFLNMNDCETKTKEYDFVMKNHAKNIGKIDILASQFTFASYLGKNLSYRKKVAKTLLDKVGFQVEVLKPKYFIPFASFAYFSHPESFSQNKGNNTVIDIYKFINKQNIASPIILYPGDSWKLNQSISNEKNIKKFKAIYQKAYAKPLKDGTSIINIEALAVKGEKYKNRLLKKNYFLRYYHLSTVNIWINDLNQSVQFNLSEGLKKNNKKKSECDLVASSDLISTWFDFDYGGATLYISGRMSYNNYSDYRKVYKYFFISNGNNRGEKWPWFEIKRRLNVRLNMLFNLDIG